MRVLRCNSELLTRPALRIENRAPGFETEIAVKSFRDGGLQDFAFDRPNAINDHANRHAFGIITRDFQRF